MTNEPRYSQPNPYESTTETPGRRLTNVRLYASPLACSGAAHMILLELGIAHTIEFVDIYAQPHAVLESGALYKELNAKDAVPALEFDAVPKREPCSIY